MHISRLWVRNYRTLADLDLAFPAYYSAICGKNDSGKSNVVRVIRQMMREELPPYMLPDDDAGFSLTQDYTKWVESDSSSREITVGMEVLVDPNRDAGLYEFFTDYLKIEGQEQPLALTVEVTQGLEGPQTVKVQVGGEEFSSNKAEEVLKRLQTSRTFLFHSSTDPSHPFMDVRRGILRDVSAEYSAQVDKAKAQVDKVLKRIARDQQSELEGLLGRLSERYKVSMSLPSIDLSYFPYNLTLGDRKVTVDLDSWGSGTRNRTLVLLTIFRARQMAEAESSASKVTPVIVIEEPESFLHPLAQAEFGRVLQELAEEFKVQIIVTTHSPYLLSHQRSESNILLERRVVRSQLRETVHVETEGDAWMEPFALALGIRDEEFRDWRGLFFSDTSPLLLVEGEVDAEYFELLRGEEHGEDRLEFDGEIFAYGGFGTLKNQSLLKFIRDRYEKVFVTFDLDAEAAVEKPLKALGFEKRKTYLPVGLNKPGKRCIEGLLPDSVRTKVYGTNPDLVQALQGTSEERREAQRELKIKLLEQFRDEAVPGEEYFGEFYKVVKLATKALG